MRTTIVEFPGEPEIVRRADGAITVAIPIRIKRYSGRKQVVLPASLAPAVPSGRPPTALQVALARGHRWLRQIESGQVANIAAIAKRDQVDASYISRMVNLTTLAPDLQAAILDETLPEQVSLFTLAADTPLTWEEQRQRVADAAGQPPRAGQQPAVVRGD